MPDALRLTAGLALCQPRFFVFLQDCIMKIGCLIFTKLFSLFFGVQHLIFAFAFSSQENTNSGFPDLYEASIAELQDGLKKGLFTSVDLVKVSS